MRLARGFCWIGAVVDAGAAAALLSPALARWLLGIPETPISAELVYAMRTGAALMIGWTCLLLWAAARPVERRGVILLTVVPVIAGLVASELLAVRAGFLALANVAPLLVLQGLLAALGLAAHARARAAAPSAQRVGDTG